MNKNKIMIYKMQFKIIWRSKLIDMMRRKSNTKLNKNISMLNLLYLNKNQLLDYVLCNSYLMKISDK